MKVVTVLGTRPEIIRLSAVMARLDQYIEHKIVHTGQNYDFELNEIFFRDLKVRKPDYFLNVDTSSVGHVYGGVLEKSEEVFRAEKPDAVLILGDTNSSLASIMARRMKIPIYHMEAGNRCYDLNVPEETNRKIIDHISDFNLVYTEHARRQLLSEGIAHRRIYLTGSPMREVLSMHIDAIKASQAVKQLGLEPGKFLLVSLHREENVDNQGNLMSLLTAIERAAETFDLPVIVSTHPRTRKRIENLKEWKTSDRIRFMKPFGFLDYVNLQTNAFCVISDSGTICEESSLLDFPAITCRNAIERPEAMDAGTIVVTGLDPQNILDGIRLQTSPEARRCRMPAPADYQIENTSWRVVKLIMGTAKLVHLWDGVRACDLG
jgi:UDP-N-acetylglucosamine 2-epimerase (non-hydrolysing)